MNIFKEKTKMKKTLRSVGKPAVFLVVFSAMLFTFSFSSAAMSPPAYASNIVSDLRNCKAAAFMYLEDHSQDITPKLIPNVNNIALLHPYVDNPGRYAPDQYAFCVTNNVVWVGFNIQMYAKVLAPSIWARLLGETPDPVEEKLESRSVTVGLLSSSSLEIPPVSNDSAHSYKKGDGAVWLFVR